MSVAETTAPPPQSTASQMRETPGAFPQDSEFIEDVQLSSDLNSLSRAVKARRAEYTRQQKLRVRIGTWNVAALPGTEEDIGKWFTDNTTSVTPSEEDGDGYSQEQSSREDSSNKKGKSVDLYILGLQEVIDISSPSEALRPYVDPAPSNKWKAALETALPPGYELVSSQQLMGLLLLVYAAPSVAPSISSISSSSVGTGLMGYMGNKGAVATRIVLGGTARVVFLNCHLAAGTDKASYDRRQWDTLQILSRMKFDPVDLDDDVSDQASLTLGQEDFAFWFGDLNYRLDKIPGEDVRRLLHLHTENRFRPSGESSRPAGKENVNPSAESDENENGPNDDGDSDADITLVDNDVEPNLDPASLQTTLSSLLPHDQLHSLQKIGKAFHEGWREGEIVFLPTYKYDVGWIGKFDSSEKQRSPSWCDRILYRTRHDHSEYLRKIREGEEAKKRDEEMKRLGLEQEAEDEGVLFDYDPEADGVRDTSYDENEDGVDGATAAAQTTEETANLIGYNSHQDIVSSDHKPVHGDFVLVYDAVDPDLKAKVHQEVVRELDRAENETRPDITVVVDQPSKLQAEETGKRSQDTIDFGQVRYGVPVSRGLTLANTGGVSSTFSFHHRLNDDDDGQAEKSALPSWLQVSVDCDPDRSGQKDGQNANNNTPPEYTLSTGDSVQAQFVLCISDINLVRDLNRGKADIEDILVLRVNNGRDQFLSIRGEWQPTCFGLSLLELTRIPEGGIRQLDRGTQLARLGEGGDGKGSDNGDARMSAPHELFRLTEAVAELTERSVAEWGMTGGDDGGENEACPWASEQSGSWWPFGKETWKFEQGKERKEYLACIREALDTGASFSTQFPPEFPARFRVEVLAETLLSFLGSLDDGLITEQLWQHLEQQMLAHEKLKRGQQASLNPQSWILDTLSSSPLHSVSFTFLTFMLNRVANEIAPVPSPQQPPPPPPPSAAESGTSSTSRTNTTGSVPSPASPTPSSSGPSLPFPFRFKSRSRAVSSSGGSEPDSVQIPTSSPTTATTPTTATAITPTTPSFSAFSYGTNPASPSPALVHRRAVNRAFASVFAEVIFSGAIAKPQKDKERRAWEERKRGVLEPFLSME